MQHRLYLASDSFGRKNLLKEANISFETLSHSADESSCSLDQLLEQLVRQLAVLKMDHVSIPNGQEGDIVFVLTADTMTVDCNGTMLGKPLSIEHAYQMIRSFRNGSIVGTAFCLVKKRYENKQWITVEQIVDYDEAQCVIDIPESFLQSYVNIIPVLTMSGGCSIMTYGEQFLKKINGNYSAVLGMPMFKLREALFTMNYYE